MTRFGNFLPIWPKVNDLRQTFEGLFSFGEYFEPTLAKKCFGANFNCCKWQNIEKHLASGHTDPRGSEKYLIFPSVCA